MPLSPFNTAGKEMQELVAPLEKFNYFGSSLNPIYASVTDGVGFPAIIIRTFCVFVGNPITLDMSTMGLYDGGHPNHECLVAQLRLLKADMNDSPVRPVTYEIKLEILDKNPATVIIEFDDSVTIPVGFDIADDITLYAFVGLVNDEIDENASASTPYSIRFTATEKDQFGTIGNQDIEIIDVITTNSDITSYERGAGTEGSLWIESQKLHYIDSEQFEHAISFSSFDVSGADDGEEYVWIDSGARDGILVAGFPVWSNPYDPCTDSRTTVTWRDGNINYHGPISRANNGGSIGQPGNIFAGGLEFRQRGALNHATLLHWWVQASLSAPVDIIAPSFNRQTRSDDGDKGNGAWSGV